MSVSQDKTSPVHAAGSEQPVLQAKNIHKSFGAVEALRGVDFEAYAGQVTALLGDNGAGKSTLIKCIAGTHVPDAGEILVDGEVQHFRTPADATRAGLETVYQDLALCDNLDVVANLFLGREEGRRWIPGVFRTMREAPMEKQSTEALSVLRINIPSVRNQVAQLSGGQRQSIAVARAVLYSPKVVILDEPTAALGVAQTKQVLDLVLRLREQGLTVIVITHNMVDVFEVADHASVMRLGKRVATFNIKESTPEDVVAAITGAKTFEPAVTA
ncbi:MAG: ATP-binding cassette domain-containing protein [Chloroflexota bacterium]